VVCFFGAALIAGQGDLIKKKHREEILIGDWTKRREEEPLVVLSVPRPNPGSTLTSPNRVASFPIVMNLPPLTKALLLAAFQTLVLLDPASGRDYVLTIGGGYSPAGNQVSLERNVIFFRKLLAETYPAGVPHDLLFADGDSPNPDLNYLAPDEKPPKANLYAALLFGRENNLGLRYRNNELDKVKAMSSPETLEKWFKESGSKLKSGDRLILYITAHGGRSSDKKNKGNTKLYMWNGNSIDARTMANHLQALPEGIEIMTVMVQCYSGGFANLLFKEVDASKGPGARPLCGFFATVQDRIAAGCTPEINEANYDEYSSHFWAAIRGKTRTGKSVPSADYDGDGRVSFEEAHAYTLLTSLSLDVPVKTTDTFLRAHSKMKSKDHPDLLGVEHSYFQLLTKATPVELAVLNGLSTRLGLNDVARVKEARDAVKKIDGEVKKIKGERDAASRQYGSARKKISYALKNRWPDLENSNSPVALELFTSRSGEFIKAVEEHPAFKEMMDLRKKRADLEKKRFELDKKWAHHQRLLRAVETLVLRLNLPKVADEKIQQQYAELWGREQSFLGAKTKVVEKRSPADSAAQRKPKENQKKGS
jgi:hypothetical protein